MTSSNKAQLGLFTHQALSSEFRHLMDHTVWKVQDTNAAIRFDVVIIAEGTFRCFFLFTYYAKQCSQDVSPAPNQRKSIPEKYILKIKLKKAILPVFGADIGHDVLVEELEDEWDTVGKDQMLGDNFKLQEKKRQQKKLELLTEWSN